MNASFFYQNNQIHIWFLVTIRHNTVSFDTPFAKMEYSLNDACHFGAEDSG
ncbi:MAG: hypothetical protein K0B81_03600 [Candidatus Cloacimonetes bacterium]|nr:hypothetical protein [Candidatus Cloacimonadota bacterium]